jgi:hypothetical protein
MKRLRAAYAAVILILSAQAVVVFISLGGTLWPFTD